MSPYRKPFLHWGAAFAGLVIALLSEGWGEVIGLAPLALPLLRLTYTAWTLRQRAAG
jgi:hypothetical protein